MEESRKISELYSPFNRENFLNSLLGHLASTLEEVIGIEESSGFISIVGQKVGEEINAFYKESLRVKSISKENISQIMVDLKERIGGDFYLIELSEEKIVLGNRACPFGDKVIGNESLCMMTSNVFGTITAQNLGYAQISLEKTISRNDKECLIVIYLRPNKKVENHAREYFKI